MTGSAPGMASSSSAAGGTEMAIALNVPSIDMSERTFRNADVRSSPTPPAACTAAAAHRGVHSHADMKSPLPMFFYHEKWLAPCLVKFKASGDTSTHTARMLTDADQNTQHNSLAAALPSNPGWKCTIHILVYNLRLEVRAFTPRCTLHGGIAAGGG